MVKKCFEALRMLAGERITGSTLCSHHQGNPTLIPGHKAVFRRLVDQLVHYQACKVDEEQLNNRSGSDNRRANPHTDKRCLRKRGVDHSLRAEFLIKLVSHFIRTTPFCDTFSHTEYQRIPCHLLFDCKAECISIFYNRHVLTPDTVSFSIVNEMNGTGVIIRLPRGILPPKVQDFPGQTELTRLSGSRFVY